MRKAALALLLVLVASSCATTKTFLVQIDSIGNNAYHEEKTYIFVPTEKDVKADDLRFIEYTGYIEKVLSKKGYTKVDSAQDANIIVYVMYGVGDPQQHQYAYSVPVYGQIGVVPHPPASGHGPGPGNPPESFHKAPFGHFSPVYGIIGSTTHYESYVTYFRYCKIEAFDLKLLKENDVEKQLWSTVITSTGASDDLRLMMPYMIAGAQDYIATDTGKKVEVTIDENDKRVEYIK